MINGEKTEVFTVELKKTEKALSDFLKKIKAKASRKNQKKIGSYVKYAKSILDNKLGEIFVNRSDIQKLMNKFNILTKTVEGLIRFSRKIKLSSPIKIGEKIYPINSVIKLTHEV